MRKITPKQLKDILEAHEKWVRSGGKEGERAALQNADLRGANLQKADLHGVNLQDSILREADLQDANLEGVEGFSVKQLAGSRVSGIKLPESAGNINELDRVEEASKNARKIFQLVLLACLYALLTIATTSDVNLLTNSASSPLPIIGAAIPIVGFYLAAPIFLLGFYIYFHLYLQRLWEEFAFQPAIFPDGKRLDEKAYPWLLNGFVYSHFKHLRDDCPPLSGLQHFISILLAWWAIPITLSFFWGRYLARHEWVVTAIHIIVLSVSIWVGIRFYLLAALTFRGEKRFSWEEALRQVKNAKPSLAILAIVIFLAPLYSFGAINNGYSESLDPLFSWTIANFVEADVSTKPPNWKGRSEDVKGANLRGRNLQRARASRAFLVKADLREANLISADLWDANLQETNCEEANLQKANLQKANLRGANLQRANLQRANIGDANLQGANLWRADLQGANLWLANLKGASLVWADLRKVKLQGAFLGEANLSGANLKGASLAGADLTNARNLTKEQIESAHIDDKTKLPAYLQKHFRKQQ